VISPNVDFFDSEWRGRLSEKGVDDSVASNGRRTDDRLVINAIPAQVWRADPDGRIQFVNDVWLDYTGLSVDQTLAWAWTTGM